MQAQPGTLMLLHADRSVLGRQETAAWVACGGVAFCLAYTLVFVPESLSRPAQLLVSPPADSHSWYYLARTLRYPKAGTLLLLLCTFRCAHAQQPGAGAWSSCAAIECTMMRKCIVTSIGRHWGDQMLHCFHNSQPCRRSSGRRRRARGQAQQPGLNG